MQANQAQNETRLPRAVLRRSAAIQARIDAQNQAATPETVPPTADPETPTEAPPAADTPPVEATPAPVEPPKPVEDDVDWKQLAKSVQGRLTTLAEQRRQEMDGYKQAIAELQGQIQALKDSQQPPSLNLSAYFTPEQIEQFGEDQCEAMLAGAEKRMRELLQDGLRPVLEGRRQDAEEALEARKREFINALLQLVPDYAEIDNDPAFTDGWLEGIDEASGIKRGNILDHHVKRFDATHVAKIFQGFKASRHRPTPPMAPSGTAAGGSPEPQPTHRLTAPTNVELKEYFKRAALGKVSEQERANFEARMALRVR